MVQITTNQWTQIIEFIRSIIGCPKDVLVLVAPSEEPNTVSKEQNSTSGQLETIEADNNLILDLGSCVVSGPRQMGSITFMVIAMIADFDCLVDLMTKLPNEVSPRYLQVKEVGNE